MALTVDVGGSHEKALLPGDRERRRSSDEGGRILFLGLGIGLGSALIADRIVEPLEPERNGTKKWRKAVFEVVERLAAAMQPDLRRESTSQASHRVANEPATVQGRVG